MRSITITGVLICLAAIQAIKAEKAPFIDNDWNKARAEALKQHKYLFVDAYTDWCSWCKVMDKQTFPDTAVSAFMQQNFICLRMEMEHNYGIKLNMKYHVPGFPTFLIFSPQGKMVYKIVGYQPANTFLENLQKAVAPVNQKTYSGVSDKIELDFPELYQKAFIEPAKRQLPTTDELQKYLDSQKDLFSEVNAIVMERFFGRLPDKYVDFMLTNRQKYEKLYGEDEFKDAVNMLLGKKIQTAEKDTSLKELDMAINFAKANVKNIDNATIGYYYTTFYLGAGQWKNFGEEADKYFKAAKTVEPATVNQWCWTVYEKCSDPEIINKAVDWMQDALNTEKQYAYMDTYAALLYKAKKYESAEKYAREAIELGKKSGEDTKTTQELLDKIIKEKQ